MSKNRMKPNAKSYANTGSNKPISISNEKKLDKAIAEATTSKDEQIRVLTEENERLKAQIQNENEDEDATND